MTRRVWTGRPDPVRRHEPSTARGTGLMLTVGLSVSVLATGCSASTGSVGVGAELKTEATSTAALPVPGPTSSMNPIPGPDPGRSRAPVGGKSSAAWIPGPGEIAPEVKEAAAAFVSAAGTWTGGVRAARQLASEGVPTEVAATATALDVPDATSSSVEVIYPQYGGLTADQAAVIVLFDQVLGWADGRRATRQLVLDVRLVRQLNGSWTVRRVNPTTSLGPDRPLTDTAKAVLAEPRLRLSVPAQIDVRSGRMDDRLLRVLLGLATEHTLTVQVMHTGHIQTVFPSERRSNHAVGRAVDIRVIDDAAIVSPATPDELLAQVMLRAGELGATEVGGPLSPEGAGFFTDNVHQDHLHIGISEGRPPAGSPQPPSAAQPTGSGPGADR
jgi:hypothetical protein